MAGECLGMSAVGPGGIVGDRGWALWDVEADKALSATRAPALLMCSARYLDEPTPESNPQAIITLPDGSAVRTDEGDANQRLNAFLGREVSLRSSSEDPETQSGYFNETTHSLMTTASLDALGELLPGSQLEFRRFRSNIIIQTPTDAEGFVEREWIGSTLAVGDVKMEVVKPIPRCPIVSAAQADLPKDEKILKTIVNDVEKFLGIYGSMNNTGIIRVGDVVSLD